MLPGFHAAQHLLLTVCRQAVEVLQALFELLLALGRKPPKLRIVLQCAPLLIKGKFAVLVQPLSGMMALRRRLISLRRAIGALRLRLILRSGSRLHRRAVIASGLVLKSRRWSDLLPRLRRPLVGPRGWTQIPLIVPAAGTRYRPLLTVIAAAVVISIIATIVPAIALRD